MADEPSSSSSRQCFQCQTNESTVWRTDREHGEIICNRCYVHKYPRTSAPKDIQCMNHAKDRDAASQASSRRSRRRKLTLVQGDEPNPNADVASVAKRPGVKFNNEKTKAAKTEDETEIEEPLSGTAASESRRKHTGRRTKTEKPAKKEAEANAEESIDAFDAFMAGFEPNHRRAPVPPSVLRNRSSPGRTKDEDGWYPRRLSTRSATPDVDIVSVEPYKSCGHLWDTNPGSSVLCEGCNQQVPREMGALQGDPARSQMAWSMFWCSECIHPPPHCWMNIDGIRNWIYADSESFASQVQKYA